MSPITEHTRAMRETYDPQPSGPQHRWPVVRETKPGALAPNTPDPAEGVSGFWIALGLVGAIAALVLGVNYAANQGWLS
jgi:hypothetical protein